MIKAQEAREITMENSIYTKHLNYYKELTDMLIREAASNGQNNCILEIKSTYPVEIATEIIRMLSVDDEYTIRAFKSKSNGYGLWIFW